MADMYDPYEDDVLVGSSPVAQRGSAQPEGSFASDVLRSFAYPLRGPGVVTIVVLSVAEVLIAIAGAITLGLGSLVGGLLLGGYVLLYLFTVIGSSADGQDDPPSMSTITVGGWGDIFYRVTLIGGVLALSFLPLFGAKLWAQVQSPQVDLTGWVQWSLLGWGVLYLPMALLGTAMYQSAAGLMPWRVLPAIVRLGPVYLPIVTVLTVVWLVPEALGQLVPQDGGAVWLPVSMLAGPLQYYITIVCARLIGLMYWHYSDRIDWFD